MRHQQQLQAARAALSAVQQAEQQPLQAQLSLGQAEEAALSERQLQPVSLRLQLQPETSPARLPLKGALASLQRLR